MATLTKDAILSASDIPAPQRVEVPEWGGESYIRTMTGTERDAFETSIVGMSGKERNLKNVRARLLVKTLCDADGKRLFDDGDADALGRRSAAVLDRLFTIAQKINGLSKSDVDELVGNSGSGETAA